MKIKLETVTPEMARNYLKKNDHNRRVRERHVDFLASEISNGRWVVTSETIALSPEGMIVDGQHRLLAIAQAGIPVQCWIASDVPMDVQDKIDFCSPRNVADQLGLGDGVANATLTAGACRVITSICCYYQMPKSSVDFARLVHSEFRNELEFCIEKIRPFRPGYRAWVIGALAFAMSADKGVSPFIEAFGSGENLVRGNPAKAARDWILNGSINIDKSYKRGAIEGLLNAAYNGVNGGSISSVKRGAQGVDYFTGKKRRTVATLREQMKHQLNIAA